MTKLKTFNRLLPEANVIIYDADKDTLEVDGRELDINSLSEDIEKEFLKDTEKEYREIDSSESE